MFNRINKIRHRFYEVLEFSSKDNWLSRLDDIFLMALIGLNAIAVVLETEKEIFSKYKNIFEYFELISICIFTVEYILRIWICTEKERYNKPFWGRLRFIFTPLALVDLFAILPFYIPFIIPVDLRFIRILRLFRVVRLLKLSRYVDAVKKIGRVVREKKEELVITLMAVIILLFISSCLMYYIENQAQPETFSSIPKTLWWGVVTLTTVGYGDVYPITPLGKFFGSVIAFLGIGLFALPTGILASGFAEEINKSRSKKVCPHCGKNTEIKQ